MKDPIVEEVRRHRMEHTKKFNGDLSAICADLRSIQGSSGHTIIRLKPKEIVQRKESNRREKQRG